MYLNVILQLIWVSKSLITLSAGKLRRSMRPTVPCQLAFVVEHQRTLGALQCWVLVHHCHVALQIANLSEHLSTVATGEIFNRHLKIVS